MLELRPSEFLDFPWEFRTAHRAWLLRQVTHLGVRTIDELVVYRLSLEFKRAAYRLVRGSPADRDLRYRDQLFEALLSVSANIAEGFGRRTTGDFCLFLTYARGSLAESMTRLEDGVERGHFTASACQDAIILGRRTGAAIAALQKSLRPFLNSGGRRR